MGTFFSSHERTPNHALQRTRRERPHRHAPRSPAITGGQLTDWRLAHCALFLVFLAGGLALPVLRHWPWVWLVPFVAYFLLVGYVPRLRHSMVWLRVGQLSVASVAVTVATMVLTVLTLVLFHNPSDRTVLPVSALGGGILAAVVFTVVNATLEELVFRGVLFDALQSQRGNGVTLATTALLFGFGHLHGYPPGVLGACLAALFGLAMGGLRLWTGGLVLPIIAHMAADATIYSLLRQ